MRLRTAVAAAFITMIAGCDAGNGDHGEDGSAIDGAGSGGTGSGGGAGGSAGGGAGGADASACVDRCADGVKACDGNGVKTCSRQSDGCLGWSSISPCGATQYCDAGECKGNCSDTCTADAKQCKDDGIQTCAKQAGGCLGWGAVVPCPPYEACTDGLCQKTCTDKCTKDERVCTATNGIKTCTLQTNGCYDWSSEKPCQSYETCSNGACVKSCVDLCSPGASYCDAGGVRTCAPQANGCHDWGQRVACPGFQVCSAGRCLDNCVDGCTAGATLCSGMATMQCKRNLATGCTEWTSPTACATGTVCSAGACAATCVNQCTEGLSRCAAGSLVQTCMKLDSGCTDWTLPKACASGQLCPAGGDHCVALPCARGETRCNPTTSNTVDTCDASGNWISTQSCSQGCDAGKCATTATCSPGAPRCNGMNVEVCNSSGTAWLANQACGTGCAAGLCTGPCQVDSKRCNGRIPEQCNGTGAGWVAGPECSTMCWSGTCVDADLVVDGVTVTMDGEHVYQNGVIVRNGGQIKVGAQGWLVIRAKTLSVDAASSIVASNVGQLPRASGSLSCSAPGHSGGWIYSTAPYRGGSYGTASTCAQTIFASDGCSCLATDPTTVFGTATQMDIAQGMKDAAGNLAGGMFAAYMTDSMTIAGSILANGTGNASGGGILLAADSLTISGALQATGGGCGGKGRIKLLYGTARSITGSVDGVRTESVMPPLTLVSGSHPVSTRWYNDGLGDWNLAWERPFSTLNGYYVLANTTAASAPTPASGTYIQQESSIVTAGVLKPGANYFHIVGVDSGFNVGTVENVALVQVSPTPPTVASTSHPSERSWSANDDVYLTWTNPHEDASFTGYYYVFDHFADTVPTAATGVFTANKQVLLSDVAPGIWVFHLVNRDTRNATTKAARHYVLYIGTAPGKGNLSGSIFDGSNANAPLDGVTISINRGLFTMASTAGTYTFSNELFEGAWQATASKAGYVSQTKTVFVTAGEITSAAFTLTKAP